MQYIRIYKQIPSYINYTLHISQKNVILRDEKNKKLLQKQP